MSEVQISFKGLHDRVFEEPNRFNPDYINKYTAVDKLATLIDSQWKHSMYWDTSNPIKLVEQISSSLDRELKIVIKRASQLYEAQKILESITEEVEQ